MTFVNEEIQYRIIEIMKDINFVVSDNRTSSFLKEQSVKSIKLVELIVKCEEYFEIEFDFGNISFDEIDSIMKLAKVIEALKGEVCERTNIG